MKNLGNKLTTFILEYVKSDLLLKQKAQLPIQWWKRTTVLLSLYL